MEKKAFDLDLYPEHPGVYLMKDRSGAILYIGKAKNIKNRLRQYIHQSDTRAIIPHLLSSTQVIETIICFTEKEALLLESTLIKKHQPKYNTLLKDDKSFICLFIDPHSQWPTIKLVRSKDKHSYKGLFFGPYNQTPVAKAAHKTLCEYFGLRQCSDYELARRHRPCLLYEMKKCLGPCKNLCTKQQYQQATDGLIKTLEGHTQDLFKDLKTKIQQASDQLAFEQAGSFYKTLKNLETICQTKQFISQTSAQDRDIIYLYQQGPQGVLIKLSYREGHLTAQDSMEFNESVAQGAELLSDLILQHYQTHTPAANLIVPLLPENHQILTDIFYDLYQIKVRFVVPLKGDKKALLELAAQNAKVYFEQRQEETQVLSELQTLAQLTRYPDVIDCFDVSHFSGSSPCAVRIRIVHGKIEKKSKRLFHLRQASSGDDYGAMKEVLLRTLKRAQEDDNLPDLILVDGGKGQVAIAQQVLEELNIACCDLLGLVKQQGRHDKGLVEEKVILPSKQEPLILDKSSVLLFFLQKIRDEAHRAAILFNRKNEKVRLIKSVLDQIPGIGKVKKKALLKTFGSTAVIAKQSVQQLQECPGLSAKEAQTIFDFFSKLK